MATDLSQDIKTYVHSLCGLRCWHVSVGGGCTMPTFQLALGEKVRRARPLMNRHQPEEYRQFEGEFGVLVWCPWRMDSPQGPVTSWYDTEEHICEHLRRLVGAKVRAASVSGPGRDLRITFANRLTMCVFCDKIAGDPTWDGNWEMWGHGQQLVIAAGSRVEITPLDDKSDG
jgi:hypothetical protein